MWNNQANPHGPPSYGALPNPPYGVGTLAYGAQPQPYGLPPAGAVPQVSPYHPQAMFGEEIWTPVKHGDPFPYNVVQAMDRPLSNSDHTATNCYVALWHHAGEAVFGRAWNKHGRVEAWFPWGGREHHSGGMSPATFSLLTYQGPPQQNFRYAWVPVSQLNSMCQPVTQQGNSPVVIPDVNIGLFHGELLGKGDLGKRAAWVSYAGREHQFKDAQLNGAYALCRVPL